MTVAMTSTRRQAVRFFAHLAGHLGQSYRLTAQSVDGYRVTGLTPGDVDYTDADWDGSAAEAKYPNPGDDDTDLEALASHYLFIPDSLSADDPPPKSAFKGPIRQGEGGPVNTNALIANLQAINGARGGFDGIDAETLRAGFEAAVDHLVSAGRYDDAADAPDMDVNARTTQPGGQAQAQAGGVKASQADLTGTVQFEAETWTATAADGSTLTGIVWGAGDHDLALGGQPTPVRVPPETIRPTFDALQEDVDAGKVTLGFDHPGEDSVAARTGIVDIGTAEAVDLTSDGQHIVLVDSDLQNDQAAEAVEAGDFDGLDWSIVADVAMRRDDNGDPVQEDGRVVLDATRITRIDAVDTGAVDAASIERGTSALPDLAGHTDQVAAAAADPRRRSDAVTALQASATALSEHMTNATFDPDVGDDVPEAVQEQLDAAATIIDDQEDELETATAKATGFDDLMSAHGVDLEDFDDPQAAAQAVIDEQTAETRREIAELEADLAQFDVDDVDERAAELAGSSPDDVQQTLNARKATAFDAQRAEQNKGRAAAKGDGAGRSSPVGGTGDGGDAEADDLALQAMDGRDRIEAQAAGLSPSDFVAQQYDVQASQYDEADTLHRAIMDTINGGGD